MTRRTRRRCDKDTSKGFEYAAQLVPRNAFTCVMNLGANGRPATSTAHEYALDSEEKGLM